MPICAVYSYRTNLGGFMPKFLVKMNVVEARETSFIIEADNENDIHDGLSELSYNYFERNCDWVTTEYEIGRAHV